MELTKNGGKGRFTMDGCIEGRVLGINLFYLLLMYFQQFFEGENHFIRGSFNLVEESLDFVDYVLPFNGIGCSS